MKKILKLLLSSSMLFTLVACSSKQESKKDDTSSTINEETIQAAAYSFLSKDTQCTEELLGITSYSSPSVSVHFYDVDQDDQVELLVMASEENLDYTYMVYEYNASTGGFDLSTYFTNNPVLDDGALSYSITRGSLFTFAIAQNNEGNYDCLIDYWSDKEPMTATREIYVSNHADGTFTYIISNWDGNAWVEESNTTGSNDSNAWKEDVGEYIILSGYSISQFVSLYE